MKCFPGLSVTWAYPLSILDLGFGFKCVKGALITSHNPLKKCQTLLLKSVKVLLGQLHSEVFLFLGEYSWHKFGTHMSQCEVLADDPLHSCPGYSCGGRHISDGLAPILLQLGVDQLDVVITLTTPGTSGAWLILGRSLEVTILEGFVPGSNLCLAESTLTVDILKFPPTLNGSGTMRTQEFDHGSLLKS